MTMKQSFFNETSNDKGLRTPSKGLNATVKNSLIFLSSVNSSEHIHNSVQQNKNLMRDFNLRSKNLLQNPTTYDNSLAKPNKVSKSLIKLNLLNSSSSKQVNSHSQSESKRKKFISITQRGKEPQTCVLQKKLSFATGKPANHQLKSLQSNNATSFSTFRQLMTPASALKEYWSTMIQTLSGQGSKVQEKQGFEENILSEDVLPGEKTFSVAQKARIERKNMMNSLTVTQINGKSQTRVYTEVDENSPVKKDYILITEPQCPVDSRNFMVFEEKIGEKTLTRKDSLILALMDGFDQQDGIHENNQKMEAINKQIASSQLIPSVHLSQIQLPSPTKRFTQLLIPQQQSKQLITDSIQKKKPASVKANRLKCISLIEKQQSYKYRNSKHQAELQGQFIELKKKTSRK